MDRAFGEPRLRCVLWVCLLAAGPIVGCGGGSTRPEQIDRRTEVVFEGDDELIASVRVDTVYWKPGFFNFMVPDMVELNGQFGIVFGNLGDQALEIRYELLFFDLDTFLIDRYIPLGQPVRLDSQQTRDVQGEYVIQAPDIRDLELLATMQVKAGIQAAP